MIVSLIFTYGGIPPVYNGEERNKGLDKEESLLVRVVYLAHISLMSYAALKYDRLYNMY